MAAGDRRVSWQREECPPWCVVAHAEQDHPHDRKHVGRQVAVPVLACADRPGPDPDARDRWSAEDLVVCLWRRDGATETAVYVGDGADQRIEVDLAGVRRVVACLRDLVPDAVA